MINVENEEVMITM